MYLGHCQNHFGRSVGSPEKAEVGGSIPSLATIFQQLTKLPFGVFIPFHSKTMAREDSPRLKCCTVCSGKPCSRSGQPEDRVMQGCNPSAALEAGAGRAWQHALPPFSLNALL